MLPFYKVQDSSQKDHCVTFRALGLDSVVLFCVNIDFCFWTKSEACLFYVDYKYIFLLYKKTEKRYYCSLSCTHKKWILSQEGQGSRVPTPRHFNVRFYD